MLNSKTSKIVAAVVGFTMALTVFVAVGANTASAQTMTATQLIDLLIAAGIIPADKAAAARAAVASTATTTFTRDLTVGSSGADVTALQNVVGVSPATGYFGSITKAAVQAYQASKGIITTGYVGPLTRAALNGSVTTTTTTTTTTTGGATGVINTGVEGSISAVQTSSGVQSTVYEGEKGVAVLGVTLEAKSSDISIQRVKIDLGTATTVYNKIFDTIYITEGSTVLAQADLNSNTVVKDSSIYYITLAGFNSVIPRNTKKTYLVKMDVKSGIDSTDIDTETFVIRFAANGVRGVDQAGIDQYATGITITKTVNVDPSLIDSASFTVSTNSATPKKANVIASEGSSDNELDRVTLLLADFKAGKDDVTLTDLVVDVTKAGTGGALASSSNVYVYDGLTELDSASVSSNSATFSDIDVLVAKDTTKTLTIKADIRSADGTLSQLAADIDLADVTAENSNGDSITESGSAAGETMNVYNVGPLVTLVSKSITTSGSPQNNGQTTNVSTSSLAAVFTVKVKAVGSALQFGTTGSGTPMFSTTTTSFKFYVNGTYDSTVGSNSTSTDWATPSGVSTTGLTNTWSLADGTEVTVPVTITIQGRRANGNALTIGLYSVGLEGIQPNAPYAATFMAGDAEWRTSSVSFP
ncbi:MAG: peptidoglycan-binding domain-containing protein [bacterium]|nr:peptidoglycan-binding domain-containing protein [bacterium]